MDTDTRQRHAWNLLLIKMFLLSSSAEARKRVKENVPGFWAGDGGGRGRLAPPPKQMTRQEDFAMKRKGLFH